MVNGIGLVVSAVTVYIIVSLIKPYLEAWWLPPTAKDGTPSPLHDPTIRLVALVVGALTNTVIYLTYTPSYDGPGIFKAVLVGLGAALSAIGTFHLTSSSYFDPAGARTQASTPDDSARGRSGVSTPTPDPLLAALSQLTDLVARAERARTPTPAVAQGFYASTPQTPPLTGVGTDTLPAATDSRAAPDAPPPVAPEPPPDPAVAPAVTEGNG